MATIKKLLTDRRHAQTKIFFYAAALLFFFFSPVLHAQSRIVLSSFNSGFVRSAGDNSVLFTVAGSSITGTMSGEAIILRNGSAAFARIRDVVSAVKNGGSTAPSVFSLSQNYPNPFNPTTRMEFTVPQWGHVTITIYNSIGQEVTTIFNDTAEKGKYYYAVFSGQNLASGMYIARLEYQPDRKSVV